MPEPDGPEPDGDDALAARFARVPAIVNADPDLRRRGAFLTAEILVGVGSIPIHLGITAGAITHCEPRPGLMRPWRFAIRGTGTAWTEFWRPIPAPGWHDLFALSKRGVLTMEGDLQPFVANLQYIKDILATPRRSREALHASTV